MRTPIRTLCAALPALFFIGCVTTDGDDAAPPSSAAPKAPVCAVEAEEVQHDGRLVGLTLFDGKVLVNGNISGSAKYIFENCPVEEGIAYETRPGANSMLVKWVFPKAVELRVQIDFGFGFPKGTKVRLSSPTDTSVAAVVDAPDGKWYFLTELSTPYSRPSFFAEGVIRPWSGNCCEIVGEAPVGYSHECFYGVDGDDIQAKIAVSRTSLDDARRTLDATQPGFLPRKRPVIWQFDESTFPTRAPMKGDRKAPSLKFIQRTMKKLADSTPEKPATVRVLFYGQSIVWQFWSRLMMQDLQAKYPSVKFVWRNLAIGGYEAGILRDCFEREVCPFYPDLLFFHVYGNMGCYEDMVRTAREKTTAEIVLWTSHVNDSKADLVKLLAERDDRSRAILDIAARHSCHVIDLNKKWCELLLEKGWPVKELLADGIHLNGLGNLYYKDFIEEELIRTSGAGDAKATGGEAFFPVRDKKHVRILDDGALEFAFEGNRVAAVSDGSADAGLDAEILLDGKPLASMPELWAPTRPTPVYRWQPGLNKFSFGKTPPVAEDWTLTFLPAHDGDPTNAVVHPLNVPGDSIPACFSKFVPRRFKVTGSVTGDDGEGITTENFVSKSGRLEIPIRSWQNLTWGGSEAVKTGATSLWSVHPLFTDRLTPSPAGAETLLLQGCANGEHTLTIKLPKGANCGLAGFRVWKPAAAQARP